MSETQASKLPEELLRISAFWRGRPNDVAWLLGALAQHPVELRDVRQSVTHTDVSVSILIALPAGMPTPPVMKDVLFEANAREVTVRFHAVSSADELGGGDQPRHILTLLARQITAEQLARVSGQLDAHGVEIESMRRLAGTRVDGAGGASASRASMALTVTGPVSDEQALRAALMLECRGLGVDISIQADNVYRRNRRLVAFDMDSTLIQAEVIDELARIAGVGEEVVAITEAAMRGEIDFDTSFRRRVGLLRGMRADALEEVANSVRLSEGAERLIRNLRRFGYRTAILSGGFVQVARRLQETLGIDFVHANELEIEQGVLTGEVRGEIVNGERKAELLREIVAGEGLTLEQAIAVGDGANDLPMLGIAGLGIAYHAKPLVAQTADHAISNLGLDAILYLLGFTDDDII